MADLVRDVVAVIVHIMDAFGVTPAQVGSVLLGLILSWSITQRCKRWFSLSRRATEAAAFAVASLGTFSAMTFWTLDPFPHGALWTAIATGLAAPLLYKILIAALASRWAWVDRLRRKSNDEVDS